jgi:hypothetical protein
MPGLIGSQGVRPGALNMNRVFRALRYRTEQAQKVTYHRLPIYDTDSYGVPTGTSAAKPELLLPDLPAIIRPAVTADYAKERAGNNIIGAARIYTPNITTIKNYPNFDQANNSEFNEIEGWDRLITNYRTIYALPIYSGTTQTTPNTGWTSGSADVTFTTEGEYITATLGTVYDGSFYFATSATNTLEADRLRFQIKADAAVKLTNFKTYNGEPRASGANYATTYTPATMNIPTSSWLTIDVPWITGSVSNGTSIYQSGTRYATTVTSGSSFDYEADFRDFEIEVSGAASGNKVYLRNIEFYKSVSWHVHSLKDMTDGYIIFNCVRTRGRSDSKRRAYS